MLPEEALVRILREDAGVSAMVGTRIYPGELIPDTEYPTITFFRPPSTKTRERGQILDLDKRGFGGPTKTRYRIVMYAKGIKNGMSEYMQLCRLELLVFAALQGFAGTVDDDASPPDSIEIQKIGYADDGLFGDALDDRTRSWSTCAEYIVTHSEERPPQL